MLIEFSKNMGKSRDKSYPTDQKTSSILVPTCSRTVNSDEVLEDVLGLEDVLEDRFVKSLALASALLGLGFCAVLGSRARYF